MLSIATLLLAVAVTYQPPVAYEISLAGNFGEPRPNHFHGGIDVKTGGVEGKPIYSIADGYVSRITVGIGGYGNALYITHPDGHTSVYCHLKGFAPRIARLLKRWQYAHEEYRADARFTPTDCPVARGQLVAVSGNTGASQAPHLHLEVHDSRTGAMLDPLDFLGRFLKDGLQPLGHGFMAYPQSGEGTFNGGSAKQTFAFTSHNLTQKFYAWGKVGFGVWANDYMEITYNRYGVRETRLEVDGHEVFHSVVDGIPVQSNRMVNSWGDYDHFLRYNVWYMKSFTDPGNTLPILSTDANRGIIDFNRQRDYHLKYTLRDYKGNTAVYTFTVTGRPTAIPAARKTDPRLTMRWNSTSVFSRPGMQLTVPIGMLADDVELQPRIQARPGGLSDVYTFATKSTPLFNWGELSIAVRRKVADPSKLYIVSHAGTDRFQGGTYRNGWVTGRLRELGAAYELAYDDQAPVVSPVGQGAWSQTGIVRFGLTDSGSGLKNWRGFIDGRFVLFEEVAKSPWVMCRLKDTPIARTGKMRRLTFEATDNRGNTRRFEAQIKY